MQVVTPVHRGPAGTIELNRALEALLNPARARCSVSMSASRLHTAVVAVITSNTALAAMPGNVFLAASASGLPHDAVVNATGLATVDKAELSEPVGSVPEHVMDDVERRLRRVLGL